MSSKKSYEELKERFKKIALLGGTSSLLGWDERTYMPRGGANVRAEQLALVAGMIHEEVTDPRVGELLSELEQSDLVKDADSIDAANVREIRHWYGKKIKLPKDLVEEEKKVTTLAQGEWVTARKNNDFKAFQPWLEKIVALKLKIADAYGWEGEPYNALLDDYEPGATVKDVEATFAGLRDDLVVLLGKIKGAPKKPDVSIVERDYDVKLQRIFGEAVAGAMGYDFANGRLDITTHPFCTTIGPGDTRITTRYNPKRLNDALFGTMHEAGHGLYEMGTESEKNFGMPAGEAASLGIHESQSRMWENQVGRSKSFWKYFFPQAQRIFRDSLGDVKLDDFYGAINNVQPSYIRVEADEATYNLHILLRFELERALLTGDLKPADAASEWNSRFEKYFGIKVDCHANGCLQDVHWSAGLIGYFPTYTLGNLYSAQFFAQAKKDIPNLYDQFENGQFSPLREWLREKIHRHGGRYRATVLGKKVTGESLSHKPLIDYMTAKFGEIYGF
ncbi:MAG: carboxypeptidase M32 [candidate division Zixibacteria bacterium]|nr:carboxypeptidase M32 [candidate division Zixibacteria bacterium]